MTSYLYMPGAFYSSKITEFSCLFRFFYFLIYYIPKDTFKSCWFLIQNNHNETKVLKMEQRTTGDYHVTFLSRHPSDNHLCDDNKRWRYLWYEYKNIPVHGSQLLSGPNRKLKVSNYIL